MTSAKANMARSSQRLKVKLVLRFGYSGFHMSMGKIRLLKCLKNLDLFVHGQLKTAIDDDILEWFRAEANNKGGDNYQTSINEALHQHIHQQTQEPLESIFRRVLREELSQSQSN